METDSNIDLHSNLNHVENPEVGGNIMNEDVEETGVGEIQTDGLRFNDVSASQSQDFPSGVDESMLGDGNGISAHIAGYSSRLSLGSQLESIDDAYLLYCEYARLLGFSVKKGSQSYFQKTDVIKMKLFLCSSEGKTDMKASKYGTPQYSKQHTRSECKARLRIVRDMDGPWTVSVFNTEHNHELLGPDDSYLLRSSRNLSLAKRSILETFYDSGIGVSKAFRFVKNEVGGPQNVGYTRKDAYDHVNRTRKVSKIGNADAEALMRYLQEKSSIEPFFFWRVLLDDDGRIMNFFIRDSRCASDYETFGDVVSVDTTFRTNKYNLICAPFVGMNHHRHTIMFGVGFLSDETTTSFEWLFTVFLESMNGQEPSIIFSDQDLALMNGIDYAFHSAAPRLCHWHINQNAPSHFGSLNHVKEFKEMWYHCMNGCEDEDDFDQTWSTMVQMYDLQSNNWFSSMYDLRRRWATVFTNHRFSGGLNSTSRSEGTNKVIKDICAASTSLKEFVVHFDRIIDEWRVREREEDALCRGVPGQSVSGNRLMQQAAQIYTRNVYKFFHKEAIASLSVNIVHAPANLDAAILIYIVNRSSSKYVRTVTLNQLADEVSCSCAMLSSHGMFCKHILKILFMLNVPSLPQRYILKRWTRDIKNRRKGLPTTNFEGQQTYNAETLYVNTFVRLAQSIALTWKSVEGPREFAMETLVALNEKLSGETPIPTKKKSKDSATTKKGNAPCNPPSPNHRWLPPKRTISTFHGKRKKKTYKTKKICKKTLDSQAKA